MSKCVVLSDSDEILDAFLYSVQYFSVLAHCSGVIFAVITGFSGLAALSIFVVVCPRPTWRSSLWLVINFKSNSSDDRSWVLKVQFSASHAMTTIFVWWLPFVLFFILVSF